MNKMEFENREVAADDPDFGEPDGAGAADEE